MKNKNLVITAVFIFLAAGIFAQKGNMPQKNKKTSKWRYASIATHYLPLSNLALAPGITRKP